MKLRRWVIRSEMDDGTVLAEDRYCWTRRGAERECASMEWTRRRMALSSDWHFTVVPR